MEWLNDIPNWLVGLFGIGGVGALVNIALKKLFTQERKDSWQQGLKDLADKLGGAGYALGVASSLGLSKIPMLSKIWNATFEPLVIIIGDMLIENFLIRLLSEFWSKFVEGMKSDNASYGS
ncbi:MAG: hypothetical protein H8D23_08945 [Candidatus Brocadiales bacterium]|nr:hypothetical protein [Candidatus Brocadiales bacterium]